MTASLETLVVAAYVFACSLRIPRPGPEGKVSDQELIALAVAQAATGLCSDRQFLGAVARLLPGWFPELPDQSQFNRRLRRLAPQITAVQLMVSELTPASASSLDRRRCLYRAPCAIWSWGRISGSSMPGPTRSRASQASGACFGSPTEPAVTVLHSSIPGSRRLRPIASLAARLGAPPDCCVDWCD